MRVFVYFNLHKQLWSIKALEGPDKGRVVHHARDLLLADAEPKVSEAGRQRVLRERKKNVHAGIVGDLWFWTMDADQYAPASADAQKVSYNPYKGPTFWNVTTDQPWTGPTPFARLSTRRGVQISG